MNVQFDFTELGKAINNLALLIADAFAPVIKAIEDFAIEFHRSKLWRMRLPYETITEYVERVPDVLDNPDVRWEYQVYIWQTPIRLFRRIRNR